MIHKVVLVLLSILLLSCSSSDIDKIIDSVEEPSRKTIDTDRLGTNAFVNDTRFGDISQQFLDIRDTYRLSRVRVLFNWDNSVQPDPNGKINFSFYDQIAASIPNGVQALVVVTGVPSWMSNPANWNGGNPRSTFVDRFFSRVAARYGNNPRILGFQAWNEPNQQSNPNNIIMGFVENPENFVDMMELARAAVNTEAPGKLLLNGATTAIAQGFPETLDYNSAMVSMGLLNFVDVFAIHVYGKQYERFEFDVFDFLKDVSKPIWVTESGAQGVTAQLEYGERMWPYLIENVPQIEWIFQYQYAEGTPAESTYGLVNLTPGQQFSDLATYLRDRN